MRAAYRGATTVHEGREKRVAKVHEGRCGEGFSLPTEVRGLRKLGPLPKNSLFN